MATFPNVEAALTAIKFNADGMVPAIAQQFDTGEVLMLAWANEAAIRDCFESGRACYWSRSRDELWRKGDSSGNTQKLIDFRIDCDGDTVLMLVDQKGPACHTDRPNCFFTSYLTNPATELTTPMDKGTTARPDWRAGVSDAD